MSDSTESRAIVLIGNPNTGKSTLFNLLTGLRQRTGNFPGVTVEYGLGTVSIEGQAITLLDLPGTYSLAAQSPDEQHAVDALLGRLTHLPRVAGIVVIVDASNLQRNLYLVSQLLECGRPVIVVLNMMDLAERRGVHIDVAELATRLGVPVIPMSAQRGEGVEALRAALGRLVASPRAPTVPAAVLPAPLEHAVHQLAERYRPATDAEAPFTRSELVRLLIDTNGPMEQRIIGANPHAADYLQDLRQRVSGTMPLSTAEATARYQWIRQLLRGILHQPTARPVTRTDRIDRLLTHKMWGSLTLILVGLVVFQAIYRLAMPLMTGIDTGIQWLGSQVGALLPDGMLRSLVVDGVIGGVGSVLVFLPQIVILFLFIAILEDCGYMARAAFLMDRIFARLGLSGKSFIPLLSSYACAVPGIMATRTIENRRDRFATIMVAPLMSCSARLPVYTLFIAAFIPSASYAGGLLHLQGLTLLAFHLVGLAVAIPIVWLLKRTLLRAATPPFLMELPPYRLPAWRVVGHRVLERARAFVLRAGTVILAMAIVVWALTYFPHPERISEQFAAQRVQLSAATTEEASAALAQLDAEEAAEYLRVSAFGRMGQWIEPVVEPLGWDWRLGMAALASFPAREVVIATLGTIFHVGAEVDETSASLQGVLQQSTRRDGRPLFTIPVALSLMVFFALCCQCMATVATIRRETNSWGYAVLTFTYMTVLAYGAAWAVYQIGTRWISS